MLLSAGTLTLGALPSCIQQLRFRAARQGGSLVVPPEQLDQLRRPEDTLLVRPVDAEEPLVAVRRLGEGHYLALETRCTHSGCPVQPLPDGYACTCHGSSFDVAGEVRTGPAATPLLRLPTRYDASGLRIDV